LSFYVNLLTKQLFLPNKFFSISYLNSYPLSAKIQTAIRYSNSYPLLKQLFLPNIALVFILEVLLGLFIILSTSTGFLHCYCLYLAKWYSNCFSWYRSIRILILVSINSSHLVLDLLFRVLYFVICWIECLPLYFLLFHFKELYHSSILLFPNQNPKYPHLISP